MNEQESLILADLSTPDGYELPVAIGEPVELTLSFFHATGISNRRRRAALLKEMSDLHHRLAHHATNADENNRRREAAERELAALSTLAFYFGSDDMPWRQSLQFLVETSGSWNALAWPLAPVSPPDDAALRVDEETIWAISYDLAPEVAAQLPAGCYRIKATVPAYSEDGAVSTTVESNVVTIDVTGKPPLDREDHLLRMSQYYWQNRNYDQQAEFAGQALELDPESPAALFFLGVAEEGKGHLADALQAYLAAENEFRRQFPDSYEKPEVIVQRIVEVEARLRSDAKERP